jgi:hypothetical protein
MKIHELRENIVVKITDRDSIGGIRVENIPASTLTDCGFGSSVAYRSWGAWCVNLTRDQGAALQRAQLELRPVPAVLQLGPL